MIPDRQTERQTTDSVSFFGLHCYRGLPLDGLITVTNCGHSSHVGLQHRARLFTLGLKCIGLTDKQGNMTHYRELGREQD